MKTLAFVFLLAASLPQGVSADEAAETEFPEILTLSLKLQHELAVDHLDETRALAGDLAKVADEWLTQADEADAHREAVEQIRKGALLLPDIKEEIKLRTDYGVLSEGMVRFVEVDKELKPKFQLYHCPMTKGYKYWTQPLKVPMNNPYMGTSMPKCGTKKKWPKDPAVLKTPSKKSEQ